MDSKMLKNTDRKYENGLPDDESPFVGDVDDDVTASFRRFVVEAVVSAEVETGESWQDKKVIKI